MKREGPAPATCEICGADFEIGQHSRCEECARLCCRACMKIRYTTTEAGRPAVRRALCYHCFHLGGEGNER